MNIIYTYFMSFMLYLYHILCCIYIICIIILFFFCMTYFILYDRLQVRPHLCKWSNFRSFYGWVLFHCIHVPHFYPFICQWTFKLLLHSPYCINEQCCNEHWDACVFLNYGFLRVYAQCGTRNWTKIGKGVYQGCIFSPCLFNICRVYHVKC